MPRQPRHAPGGVLHHVLNRAAGRRELIAGTRDYAAFQRVLQETVEATVIAPVTAVPTRDATNLFPLQDDAHFSTVVRYVERNPLRCGLVTRAEDWPWSSLGQTATPDSPLIALAPWPVPRRDDWLTWVNQAQTPAEVAALRHCLRHGRPFGCEPWTARMESALNLPAVRPHGRPKKRRL